MRYFVWVDFQYEMIALFLGAVGLILAYIAWGSYPKRRHARTSEEIEEMRGHEIQSGHHTEKNPIAPFLIFASIGLTVWSISYLVFVWASESKF